MYCQKCGTQNPDDTTFCSKCGNDLKSVKQEKERNGITGKLGKMGIPGFRSGKSWKMAVATLVYIFIGIPIILIFLGFVSAFVFGIGGTQTSAPTLSIVASNYPDTSGADIKIQHKGGDGLNGGEWKLSIVEVGQPALFKTSNLGNDFTVGKQIIATTMTCSDGVVTDQIVTGCTTLVLNKKYNVQLAHIPSNALLVDQIVEVKSANSPSTGVTQSTPVKTPTPTPSATPSMSIEEIKKNAIGVTYDDLFRNNENYIGKIIYYKGEINQVIEVSQNNYALRVSVTQGDYYWSDVIYVNNVGKRFLDNDIINIWGKVTGLESYTAVMGNEITIPEVDALNIELVTKAGDK